VRFLPATARIDAGAGNTLFRGAYDGNLQQTLDHIGRFAPARENENASPAAADPPEAPDAPVEGAALEPTNTPDAIATRIGLRPLEVRCTAAPGVELALDEAARLHLLGLGAGSAEDLLAAEGWARANLELIGAAAGTESLGDIVVRVLTDRPARDRRLLDGRFRVDLLREVRVGKQSAWCCVPLNADESP
jgi:hypothetical protein